MSLMQLIYTSQPFGFDESTLNGILASARRNNRRDDITGALICRGDMYLQLLEGPRETVTALFDRILKDERHVDVVSLVSGDIEERLFPQWEMRDDPARSWMWTPDQVRAGAVRNASAEEIRAVFHRLAAEPV
jgi:hypothetical protein